MMRPHIAALHHWAVTPYEWGYADCMMMLADWVQAMRGIDPGAGLRGTYGNPEWCPLGRAYRNDPEPVLRRAFAALPVVEAARLGDVALVALRGQRHLFGALKIDGGAWALKSETDGVVITRAVRPVLVWGVGYAP